MARLSSVIADVSRGVRARKHLASCKYSFPTAIAFASALLSGCSGAGLSTPTPSGPSTLSTSRLTGTLRIDVPVPASTSASAARSRRQPEYISLSTKSISIDFVSTSGGSTVSIDQNLVPGSPNCTPTGACTVAFQIAAGRYVANVLLFDGTLNAQGVPTGNALSSGQSVPVTFATGAANSVSLTLDGIPHNVQIATASAAVYGSQSTGFTFYGAAPQTFTVNALDADGNIIVGPGSPALGLTATAGFTVKNVTGGAANAFSVTPPGLNGSKTTLSASVTSPGNGCSQADAQCKATAPIGNDVQTLFVTLEFPPNLALAIASPFSAPSVALKSVVTAGRAKVVAASATGECAIDVPLDGFDEILLYANPYAGAPTMTIPLSPGFGASAVVFDPNGDLFVATTLLNPADGNTTNVLEYAPPYSGQPAPISSGTSQYTAMTVDAAGNLFVANSAPAEVQEFTPPYLGIPPKTITAGVTGPIALALDGTGKLYVENNVVSGSSSIAVYASPYQSAPKYSIALPARALALAVSREGTVFAGISNAPPQEYVPPYTATPIAIGTAVSPQSVLLDGLGNLIVNAGNRVFEYAPPYTATPFEIDTDDNVATLTALAP